jgi:hypothetical protein
MTGADVLALIDAAAPFTGSTAAPAALTGDDLRRAGPVGARGSDDAPAGH